MQEIVDAIVAEEISPLSPDVDFHSLGHKLLVRLSTENCGRARLCGMGRARPFRVNHSRPCSRGVQGGGYVGFSRHFSD